MSEKKIFNGFRIVLSIEPLLDFWRNQVSPNCPHMAAMFESFTQRMRGIPELQGDIADPQIAARHLDILAPLMSVAFPISTRNTEVSGAFMPFQHQAIYCTPAYRKLLLDEKRQIAGRLKGKSYELDYQRTLRAYALVLNRIYGIEQGLDSPLIRIVTDPQTGLERHFQITPDFQFVQVGTVGNPKNLSEKEREQILEHITNPELMATLLPPENFIFRGFTVVRAVEVTESEIISALERDLIDQESIFSAQGFKRVQDRLRTLFGQPDLKAGLAGLQEDKVLLFDDGHTSTANCLFTNSNHMPVSKLENSIWLQAVERKKIQRINDLAQEPNRNPVEQEALDHGVRSMLISPLFFRGEAIGTFHIKSHRAGAFGAVDTEKLRHLTPLFSMALKRGMEDMNNEIQSIIKEKCTAVHPSVEWRFRSAAMDHMERLRQGTPSEMEPIIFKEVIPLFGQSDVRGSSEARVQAIQADLTEQLTLAGTIMRRAAESKKWPLVDEFIYRIDRRIERIAAGLTTEEESAVALFLKEEIEPSFRELQRIGPGVSHAIDVYRRAIDSSTGSVYRRRKAFENSVSRLNERLSGYLDQQQALAQKAFPHYFEKRQTDGIDYMIYLGAALHPEGKNSSFYLKNLMLWQFETACGMAWHTRQIQQKLEIPLDTCHLVLVNHSPLAIRFRYDEKRFDVDGAYDVRHEIIKSRLDKARVKGGRQRLTQPGQIAVVYSHPQEGNDIQRHIEYLQSRGYLRKDLEMIDLENLPGVRGLKSLRVSVNLEANTEVHGIDQMVGSK